MKKIFVLLMVSGMLMTAVSCSSEKLEEESEKSGLSMEKVEISYSDLDHENGTVVPVGYSVSGGEDGWGSVNIHVTYDDRLEIPLTDTSVDFRKSDAGKYLTTSTELCDINNFPELSEKNAGIFSVCSQAGDNSGVNDIIAYFDFTVPADAKAGDVYKIGLWRSDTDYFSSMNLNQNEDEVLSNLQDGYIMITD